MALGRPVAVEALDEVWALLNLHVDHEVRVGHHVLEPLAVGLGGPQFESATHATERNSNTVT